MSTYRPPLRDIQVVLDRISPVAELCELEPFAHADPATVGGVLAEAGRFAAEVVAPTNRAGDIEGAVLTPEGVRVPAAVRDAYRRFVDAGWGALTHPAEYGGGGFPLTAGIAVREMLTAANLAFSMAPTLSGGVAQVLARHGSAAQRTRHLGALVTGEQMGTMAMTEPQAGSDLAAITSVAVPAGDGFRLTGQKIFISYGDHDLTDQIVHLVLARTPHAPSGSRGLSLFLVPKWTPDGRRNDVRVVGIEHKLGIRASPTCVLAFEGAEAELVGPPHAGLRQMFTMMNDARLGVAVQGLGVAERALQQAAAFARDRRQGSVAGVGMPIAAHPDVRRMLLTMRASVQAMRAMCYLTAYCLDLAGHHPDPDVRAEQAARAGLLTPIAKAWCTDTAVDVASLAIQVHGGMGYVEETGIAQLWRDVRITPIYEGTNGIQALDLVGRSLPAARALLARMTGGPELAELIRATEVVRPAAATPYLKAFGLVLGGWLLHRIGDTPEARFFARELLPMAGAYLAAVVAEPVDLPSDVLDQW